MDAMLKDAMRQSSSQMLGSVFLKYLLRLVGARNNVENGAWKMHLLNACGTPCSGFKLYAWSESARH